MALSKLAGGIPSPGVACVHPGCWQRDTARYGDITDNGGLVLCTAHAADATGAVYQRPSVPLPERAKGAVRKGS